MARPARFSDDDILDGTARALLAHGPRVTIADVAREIQGPSGSIYHRFASRDELLARLWIRSIRRFHVGLLEASALEDPERAVVTSARHIPAYSRAHPAEARAMLLYSRARLLESGPAVVRDEVGTINDASDAALADLARRWYGADDEESRHRLQVATRLAPYGITRPFIGGDIPAWLDDAVEAAALAIGRLGRA